MGRAGPPKKPRALHERAGTYREDRHGGGLPLGAGSVPSPPSGMTKEALTNWRRLAPLLANLGLLSARFRDVLALYCETLAEFWQHKRTLQKEGFTIVAGNQTKIPHPCVGMKDRCQSQLVKFAREIGLTPASATGLLLSPEQLEGDPMDGMEKRERPTLKFTSGA